MECRLRANRWNPISEYCLGPDCSHQNIWCSWMFIHYPSTNFLKGIGPFPHFPHFCQLLSPSSPHNESTPDSSQSISPISFSRSPKNIQKSDAHHVTKAPVISAGLRSLPGHHNSVAIPSGTLWCSTSWSMGALSPGMRVPQNPGYCLLSMGKPLGCTHILGNLHVSENGDEVTKCAAWTV